MFRRTILVAAALAACAAAAQAAAPNATAVPAARERAPVTVKILAFNDFHGNLKSPGTFGRNTGVPAAQRPPVGGADMLAGHVAKWRATQPNTLVVSVGDNIGASPLISALFHDEPAIEVLNRIGVDVSAVGNHEFDKGWKELLRLQRGGCKRVERKAVDPESCRGAEVGTPVPFEGAKFQYLAANVIRDDTGRPLLPPVAIKRFGAVRVAVVGLTLRSTPTIVTPTGVAGLTFRDEAETVNALVPRLRRAGIETVVLALHEGGGQAGAGHNSDIDGCVGDLAGSPVAEIVSRLDDAVDLVLTGHTHSAYNCSASTVDNGTTPRPTGLPNRVGRRIPVTGASAFGRVLSDIDLTIDPRTQDVVAVTATNRLVDRTDPTVTPDAEIARIVDAYDRLQAPLANAVIGSITTDLPNAANAAGEMPAGNLIADAQLAATQPAALGGAVVALMNPGGVRSPGFTFAGSAAGEGDGRVTYGEAFTVQPFGNSLVTMTLRSDQLKQLLEQQFPGCLGQTGQRILQVSNGFAYSWSASAPACGKIVDVAFTPTDATVVPPVVTGPTEMIVRGGVVLNPAKTWRVTVNNFLATGGDGFTTLVGGADPLGGAQDLDALVQYLGRYQAPAAPYDPGAAGLKTPRITKLP